MGLPGNLDYRGRAESETHRDAVARDLHTPHHFAALLDVPVADNFQNKGRESTSTCDNSANDSGGCRLLGHAPCDECTSYSPSCHAYGNGNVFLPATLFYQSAALVEHFLKRKGFFLKQSFHSFGWARWAISVVSASERHFSASCRFLVTPLPWE